MKLIQVKPGFYALHDSSGNKLNSALSRAMFSHYAKQFKLV
jgi:hypothetical protein